MHKLRIGLAQINCIVGDLEGNTAKILQYIEKARAMRVDLLCFPEMSISGYPPEGLLQKPDFIADNLEKLDMIVTQSLDIALVVGFVDSSDGLYNAAAIIYDGKLLGIHHKTCLTHYGSFDEYKYFQSSIPSPIFMINGVSIEVSICEEKWYPEDPPSRQASPGPDVIVNISASPYHADERDSMARMLARKASESAVILAYVNLVGGQDELTFDGGSMLLDRRGQTIACANQFKEELIVADVDILSRQIPAQPCTAIPESAPPLNRMGEIYAALVMGTHDYTRKNGFSKAVLGLSGGIDSSLVAAIAVDALGPENVIGISMPSRYSSNESLVDARLLSDNLGMELRVIPIEEVMEGYLCMLSESFAGTEDDITEENLQARIRGNILMALSNKFGWLVLTTGNKSEASCGYCTLYGDTAGGFAVIKDVPKTLVYELAEYRNSAAAKEIIPQPVIEKEPSAELRPGQKDIDNLPPYEILDPILEAYVEENKSIDQIAAMGFDRKMVQKIISLVDGSEFKRRQSPPGIMITPRISKDDRRLPITNRYRSR